MNSATTKFEDSVLETKTIGVNFIQVSGNLEVSLDYNSETFTGELIVRDKLNPNNKILIGLSSFKDIKSVINYIPANKIAKDSQFFNRGIEQEETTNKFIQMLRSSIKKVRNEQYKLEPVSDAG